MSMYVWFDQNFSDIFGYDGSEKGDRCLNIHHYDG